MLPSLEGRSAHDDKTSAGSSSHSTKIIQFNIIIITWWTHSNIFMVHTHVPHMPAVPNALTTYYAAERSLPQSREALFFPFTPSYPPTIALSSWTSTSRYCFMGHYHHYSDLLNDLSPATTVPTAPNTSTTSTQAFNVTVSITASKL